MFKSCILNLFLHQVNSRHFEEANFNFPYFILLFTICTLYVVVKALRYKPAGRGFDSRWCRWNFSVK
jgi:hypothetical protein